MCVYMLNEQTGLVQKKGNSHTVTQPDAMGWELEAAHGPLPDISGLAPGPFLELLTLGQPRGDRRQSPALWKFSAATSPSDSCLSPMQGGRVDTSLSDVWETRSCRGSKTAQGHTLDL